MDLGKMEESEASRRVRELGSGRPSRQSEGEGLQEISEEAGLCGNGRPRVCPWE